MLHANRNVTYLVVNIRCWERDLSTCRSNLERCPCSRGRSWHAAHCSTSELIRLWALPCLWGEMTDYYTIGAYQPSLVGAWTVSPWIIFPQIHLEPILAVMTKYIHHSHHWRLLAKQGYGWRVKLEGGRGVREAGGVHCHTILGES